MRKKEIRKNKEVIRSIGIIGINKEIELDI